MFVDILNDVFHSAGDVLKDVSNSAGSADFGTLVSTLLAPQTLGATF